VSTFPGLPTAPRGVGHLRGDRPFPAAARAALANSQLRRNLGKATATIRAKRAAVVAELPDWEDLRAAGQAIKERTLANLGQYLEQLETQVTARGGTVHWARDAADANRIVTGPHTSWCPRSTWAAPRSGRSSSGRWPAWTRA
jgi:L-lactate dehydrogenase complex protein LldF